jgi:hypothetical protein
LHPTQLSSLFLAAQASPPFLQALISPPPHLQSSSKHYSLCHLFRATASVISPTPQTQVDTEFAPGQGSETFAPGKVLKRSRVLEFFSI